MGIDNSTLSKSDTPHITNAHSMIFQTFNNDIDKSIAKIGIFNKSLWAIRQDFKHGNGLVFSIFGGQSVTAKDRQAILDLNTQLQNGVQPAKAWSTTMANCSIAAQNQARQCLKAKGSLTELANGLEITTISAKAGQVALRGLSIAGNMLAMWGISVAIQTAVKWIDKLVHSAEYAEKAIKAATDSAKSFSDSIKDIQKETVDMEKSIDSIIDRYAKLSQGVNTFTNENISLPTEQYEEFLGLNKQLTELFPSLTRNYDKNGNAILGLSGSVDSVTESIRSLVEQEKELARTQIRENLEKYFEGTDDADGAWKALEGRKQKLEEANEALTTLKNTYEGLINADTSTVVGQYHKNFAGKEQAKYIEYIKDNFGEDIAKAMEDAISIHLGKGLNGQFADLVVDFSSLELTEAQKEQIVRSYDTFYSELLAKQKTAMSEFNSQNSEFSNTAMFWLEDLSFYKDSDQYVKAAIQSLVSNIDWSVYDFKELDYDGVKRILQDSILTPLQVACDDPTVKKKLEESLSGLFTLGDTSKLNANETVSKINQYVNAIAEILEKDPLELKVMFGFEQPEDVKKRFEDSLRQITDDEGYAARFMYNREYDELLDFTKDFTVEQQELWLESTRGAENATDAVQRFEDALASANDTDPTTFDLTTYKDQIDDIQSTISTLRSALDSFNQGTLDESAVLDLMQQFPELIPYIDLAADGFGNLSEGLSTLIAQQPDVLIQSLQELKSSLNTDEERAQVDALINSLQSLSSYGDTGMEAYATTIGSTWTDTANVIENVTSQFENLAKVQEAVANGLTISANAAAELAKMYPEILTNAEYAGNGQITLNEEVVKSILAGDQSIINAQIAKLEADKAELEAKKSYAEAQLEMIKQVGEGEGNITKEVAQYRLDIANALLTALIEAGMEEDRAYAAVAANMAGNMDEYNRIVGEVAKDTAVNMDSAAVSMANSININAINAQNSFKAMQDSVWSLADSIKAAANGERGGNSISPNGGGSTSGKGIVTDIHSGDFGTTLTEYTPKSIDFDEFESQLQIDISAYQKAISNIDAQIEILKNLQATFDKTSSSANGGIGGHNYSDKIKDLEKEKDKINSALDDAKDSGSKSANETSKSANEITDEYEELFDFFERRVDVLNSALSLLKANLDNVSGSFAKNNLIDAELGITEEKFNNYTDALAMYTQKANEALSKLPADIAAKIKDGAVALTDFIGDGNKGVVEAIKEYESWADKVADCKQELAELKTAIRQLELEKFNNTMDDFQNQFNLRGNSKDLISKQVDLLKEAGELIGESFFTAQIDQSQKQIALLEEEKAKLVGQMESALTSGRVQKGTDEWLSMIDSLNEVEGNILDCKKSIEEFDNELLNLHVEVFNRIQDRFSDLSSELSNIIDLFDGMDVSDDKGIWSKEGIAQLGLLAQQYELAQHQVQQYNDEIEELKAQYAAGKYSTTEYMDKLASLNSSMWDSVEASESALNSIMNLNEARVENAVKGIEKEIDSYKELTESQIKALKASKDLHDYEKSIADKTKTINSLQAQIAAMQNDTSAATIAKRKQLEQQLFEAKADLEEVEYEHSIEIQEEALNKQYEAYEKERNDEIEKLRESLNDKETILAESFETVKENASLIGQEIATIATEHGINISNALISSWQSGEMAIASYGEVLSQNTSAFIGNIMGVENEVWNLQSQANNTASTLAWMFSTKADNLVNELSTSYFAEANLTNMTQALQQSLINTLERGYNVSSIVNSLASVENAANSAKRALDNLKNTPSSGGFNGGTSNNSNSNGNGSSNSNSNSSGNSSTGKKYYNTNTTKLPETVKDNGIFYVPKYTHYASGTRNAKGGLRVENEEGTELILPKLKSGNYAIGNAGDQIFTKPETDNLYEWAQFNPDKLITLKSLDANIMQDLWGKVRIPEPVVRRDVNSNPVQIGSLINVEGNIDSSNVKQMETIANKAVDKLVNRLYDGLIYGR